MTVSRRGWLFPTLCLVAVALLVGAYSNSFRNAFHFDDAYVVESNLAIRSVNLSRFFGDASTGTSLPVNAAYRPLVTASLALDYALGGGLDPRQFHLSQLVMLVLLGAMEFALFLGLVNLAERHWWNRYVALLAALLCCAHTTTTETMNLMHARSELLSAMGVVGSFLVYLYAPRSRRAHLYLLPMMVGALAKVQAVMFAPMFFVYVVLFEQRLSVPDLFASRHRKQLGAAIARSLPALLVGVAVFAAVRAMDAPTLNFGGASGADYLRTQFWVWLHYARLFFLPMGLTADTDWQLIPAWYDTRVLAGLGFVALLLRVLWSASKTPSMRPVAFGLAWFALALLPASSFVALAEVSNEHRTFFPYIGLSLAVVWGLTMTIKRWAEATPRFEPALVAGGVAVALTAVGANVVGTYERNTVWLSEETLWRDVAEKSPANGRGLMNYGLAKMAQGKFVEAKQLFDRAAAYLPNYATLEVNLGIVTGRMGLPVEAEAHFKRALALQPADPAAHSFYARWLGEQKRTDEAISHLQQAIRLSPGNAEARSQLLAMYARQGRAGDLKALAQETLVLAPGDPIARKYLNDRGEVNPERLGTPPAETAADLLNTSLRLYQAGDFRGSIDAAARALQIKPDSAEAYNNIAASHASLREWDEAIASAREALRLKPDFALARNNLRWAEGERAQTAAGAK
jgi:protein O-mannosyl-transferase